MKKKTQRNQTENDRFKLKKIIRLFMLILAVPFLLYVLFKRFSDTATRPANETACENFFNQQVFNIDTGMSSKEIYTILIAEIHGSNEQQIADCIESKAVPEDRLLIEYPADGQAVTCDAVHHAYARFNGKLKCFGVDVPVDDNRIMYNNLVGQVNILATHSESFFTNAQNGKDVQRNILSMADFMLKQHKLASNDKVEQDFMYDKIEFLKNLSEKLENLDLKAINKLIRSTHKKLFVRAKKYEKLSRGGPTNQALVQHMQFHQQEIKAHKNRLFVVSGMDHLDINKNTYLTELLNSGEPALLLTPKNLNAID